MPLLGRKLAKEDADERLGRMGPQAHEHQVEGEPVEGAGKVAAEGVLVQRRVAGQVGESSPALVGEEHAEELGEKASLASAGLDVVKGVHLHENKRQHGFDKKVCEHRSSGRVGRTTDLRPIAFSCNAHR